MKLGATRVTRLVSVALNGLGLVELLVDEGVDENLWVSKSLAKLRNPC